MNTPTFAGRLTRTIMITLIVLMAVVMYAIYELALEAMAEESIARYETVTDVSHEYIHSVFSDVYVAAENSVHEIESHLDNPDSIAADMQRIVKINPRIRSCGITFIADYFPSKGHWYCPYAIRGEDDEIKLLLFGSEERDYLSSDWYVQALEAKEGFWGRPFFDNTDSTTPLIAYMVPIHDKEGRAVAVLGADMALDWFTNKVQELDGENNKSPWVLRKQDPRFAIYSFILDSRGVYIMHPEKERILHANYFTYAEATPDTLDDHLGHVMLSGKKGYQEATIDDVSSFVFYSPQQHTGISVAMVVPKFTLYLPGTVFGIILLLFIAVGLILTGYVCRYFILHATKPLARLASSADEVAKGNFTTLLPQIDTKDEINRLRNSFEHMQRSLSKYVDELKQTTASKAALDHELKIAHAIQMAMLPTANPSPDRYEIDILGTLTPAKAVGGDFFDYYIREDKLLFCIGDVSGKGVPAALVMAVTRAQFRTISVHEPEPYRIVSTINQAMGENNESNMFVTLFVGSLDLHTGHLEYCNAGHDAPLLIGRGMGKLHCDSNIPVGLMPDWEYVPQEDTIDVGTTIFLYTDGLTEAENAKQEQFGEERMFTVAGTQLARKEHQPKPLIDAMLSAVRDFVGDAEQSDDLTILAVQLTATTKETVATNK